MNEKKFDSKGSVYAKGRPAYPEKMFEYLLDEKMITPNAVIADVGSGTGIFTAQIAPLVSQVFAIEPNADMREKAELCFGEFSNITSVNGSAENTTLPPSSVHLITVAQAFHWFDRDLFKRECKRILTDIGKVLLVWNDRNTSAPIIQDNFAVNEKYCPNFKGSSNGIDFSKDGFRDFFKGEFDLLEFENNFVYDKEAFVSRNLSSSYAPKTGDTYYDDYVKAIIEVFDNRSINGVVDYPYITRCYIGRV